MASYIKNFSSFINESYTEDGILDLIKNGGSSNIELGFMLIKSQLSNKSFSSDLINIIKKYPRYCIKYDVGVKHMSDLKELWINNIQLTSLPSSIGNLKNLMYLNASDNQLINLPSSIGKLTKLKKLYLHHNQLVSLPIELGKLKNLTELHIHNNQLTELPSSIGKLKNLTELWMNNNQMSKPPEFLKKLKKLKKIIYL